jgi:hypothetical protein
LYTYTGNDTWITKTEQAFANYLANGITPNTSSWAWPAVYGVRFRHGFCHVRNGTIGVRLLCDARFSTGTNTLEGAY